MKKRSASFILAILMLFSAFSFSVSAEETTTNDLEPIAPQMSYYIDWSSVGLGAQANHKMNVTMYVAGLGIMIKIGVSMVVVEKRVNGVWYYDRSFAGADHPTFYAYNVDSYVGSINFTGTAGTQYRVTLTTYARNASGYDTSTVTSTVVTCT